MQVANKLMMLSVNVRDMPKAKEFYVEKLGLATSADYRHDDDNWWVTLTLPEGGATLTLARASSMPDSIKPSTLAIYFETSDIEAAHQTITGKGVQANGVQDDLFGPGSGVKWFKVTDPDGNLVHIVQKHDARAPF